MTYKQFRQKNNEARKKYYKIHSEKEKLYDKKYRKNHPIKIKRNRERYWQTIKGIYHILKYNAIRRKISFKLSYKKFERWYNNQDQKCEYCNRIILKIPNIKRLTIDRTNNNKGYTLNNIVLACNICNKVKSNIFNYNQMKILGKIIRKIINL